MNMPTPIDRTPTPADHYDAVVVGAGFAGLYMLHRLRQAGLRARLYEGGDGIGGTWYWNRYPGAACDIESLEYSYSFDEALQQEWKWSSRFARQPEILDYMNHVADRFDLRRDIQLETRVNAAVFDEAASLWRLTTSRGETVTARYCVMATGCLSTPKPLEYPGAERYAGRLLRTQAWPREGVDFSGQRVGVIGTGSTAIQCIPIIAAQAKALTVFQRTPNYSIPAGNGPMDPDYERQTKANYPALRAIERDSDVGICARLPPDTRRAMDVSAEEREAEYERRWAAGGLYFYCSFVDLMTDKQANDTVTAFVQKKIRAKIDDPALAELLVPTDYPFGAKRICADTHYYETFNAPHVRLVDLRRAPIRKLTERGLLVGDEEHAFDALVFATGFDAMTGTLMNLDIRGRGGRRFADCWQHGPQNLYGLMTAGFPNMFMTTGPGSPSVLYNMVLGNEYHVDWIMDAILHLERHGQRTIEPTVEAQAAWRRTVDEIGRQTLFGDASSWYMGDNVPGKPRVVLPYLGGFRAYKKTCDEEAAGGYPNFVLG